MDCKHNRTEFIFKSRRQPAVQEIKVDLWHDCVVGIECLDCKIMLSTPELVITHYPYSGEPHYPIIDGKENEEKAEKFKPLPEMGIC